MATAIKYKTTKDIKVPEKIVDQVLGQDEAISIVKKIAKQKRHFLLIGEPGTGKSMIGQALAELLPKEKLQDVLSLPNPKDENVPSIKAVPKGQGSRIITTAKIKSMGAFKFQNILIFGLAFLTIMSPWWIRKYYGDIMAAASLIGSLMVIAALILFINLNKRMKLNDDITPKLIVDNSETEKTPFVDATGAHAGALLGDVLHDPLQSFSTNNKIIKTNGKKVNISTEVNKLLKRHKNKLTKKDNYLATYLNKNELNILAEKEGKIQPTEVISVNKYKSDKPYLCKIITESGKSLLVTPEHKVAVNNKGKKQYIEASKLKKGEEIFVKK